MARLGSGRSARSSLATAAWPAWAQTKIDFFFPVPVEGKLAREMTRLVKVYNESQKEVEVDGLLHRQLRRHQAQGAGRRQGRQAAVGRC